MFNNNNQNSLLVKSQPFRHQLDESIKDFIPFVYI